MKRHLLDIGSELLSKPSHFDPVYEAFASRRTISTPMTPACGEEITCSGRLFLPSAASFATVRTGEHTHSSSPQFYAPTSCEGTLEINSAPLPWLRNSASAIPGPPSEFSRNFSDAPADHSLNVLAVAPCAVLAFLDAPSLPEHGPSLVRGTITLVDAYFTTKFFVHSGTTAFTAFGFVALFETGYIGSPQIFICRDVLEQMLSDTISSDFHPSRRLGADAFGWLGHMAVFIRLHFHFLAVRSRVVYQVGRHPQKEKKSQCTHLLHR